ncbi:EamA family transporter [Spirilliplanes yamanashiensis]|uniref:Permease n=1 Tax=Spirilliplanes yamanashiensis TaxID=42233 RepID=A0A8J4DJN5_9ACTN|nr:EamA family transporter [Spirilliplanes yamanashiensis]MDP9816927.1 drug/metabolite transporter (DMT)-like permease [Spirilliplanes yamanashiensis]GIJ03418.1 permease [Spirilliplanes yamanashiensis]
MTHRRPLLGVAMVLAGSVLFAVNGTVSKLVLRAGFDAPQLTLLRAAGAFTGLLLISLVVRGGVRNLRVTRHEVPLLLAYGLCGFFLVPMLYFVAISRMPVGIALLFEYTAPLLVALWARFGQRHRVKPRLWAGLALSLAGLACVAEVWGELRLDGVGVAAGLGAAVLLALYYVLGARGVERRDTLSLCTWAFGASAVAGLLTRAVTAGTGGWEPLAEPRTVLLCAYVVVLGSIVPYLLLAASLRHLPATSVGIIGMMEPVLAATVAWITLGAGEALNSAQLVGGLLVLAGVGLAETARTAPPATTPPPAPDTLTPVPGRGS